MNKLLVAMLLLVVSAPSFTYTDQWGRDPVQNRLDDIEKQMKKDRNDAYWDREADKMERERDRLLYD